MITLERFKSEIEKAKGADSFSLTDPHTKETVQLYPPYAFYLHEYLESKEASAFEIIASPDGGKEKAFKPIF